MASVLNKKLFDATALDGTQQLIYTADSGYVLKSGAFAVANHSAAPVTLTVWVVPSGGAPANAYIYYPATNIAGPAQREITLPDLSAGDEVYMQAGSASALVVHSTGGTLFVAV
jgi:hypothetical protein